MLENARYGRASTFSRVEGSLSRFTGLSAVPITLMCQKLVISAAQVPYNEAVLIYGMAKDPSNQYLYSSDWKNGKIWTHKVEADGSLTSLGAVEGPANVSTPRTMVLHPSGKTMLVLLKG